MKTTATPETNELIRTQLARVGITPTALAAKLTLKCEDLERERDEARKIAEELRDLVPWSESEPWNFSWENAKESGGYPSASPITPEPLPTQKFKQTAGIRRDLRLVQHLLFRINETLSH
ncbi:hypothetical protein HZ994_09500 [Akkermansiaceae bacterium]|nr:hypothetical protein HZ994_09500 [Akkermansiaceae bacterium]